MNRSRYWPRTCAPPRVPMPHTYSGSSLLKIRLVPCVEQLPTKAYRRKLLPSPGRPSNKSVSNPNHRPPQRCYQPTPIIRHASPLHGALLTPEKDIFPAVVRHAESHHLYLLQIKAIVAISSDSHRSERSGLLHRLKPSIWPLMQELEWGRKRSVNDLVNGLILHT